MDVRCYECGKMVGVAEAVRVTASEGGGFYRHEHRVDLCPGCVTASAARRKAAEREKLVGLLFVLGFTLFGFALLAATRLFKG